MPEEEQGGGEPQERPEFLLDRFSTVDDQARSYAELERAYTRSQQELRGLQEAYADRDAEYEERFQELQYGQQQQQQQQYDQNGQQSTLLSMLEQARDSGDLQTELALQAAMQRGLWEQWTREQQAQMGPVEAPANAPMFAHLTEQLVRRDVPDWDEIKGDVHDVIQANEYLLQETDDPAEAVGMLKNAIAIYRYQQGEAAPGGNQPQQFDAGRQQKLQAQTMQGQGTHPGTEQTNEQWADYVRGQKLEGFKL
jgi:hypothetical protein